MNGYQSQGDNTAVVKTPLIRYKIKPPVERADSYFSILPTYRYKEQFSSNVELYQESTNWFAIFLAFLSGVFFTANSALIKEVKTVDPMILLAIQSILQVVILLIITCIHCKNPFGPRGYRVQVQLQGIIGGITLSLLYYSFRRLTLGDATTIIFSSPVIVIALSFVLLREPCGVLRITVICALFAGIVLVARPPFLFEKEKDVPYDVIGLTYAFLATFFTALNLVIIRKCSEVHWSVLVFNLSTWSLVSAALFFASHLKHLSIEHVIKKLMIPSDYFTWGMILMVATTGLIGQILIAKALKLEGAGKVSVTRSLDIVLAYMIQIFFFEEIPTTTSIVGAFLVFLSVFCMGFEREIYGICDFIP